MRLYLVVLVGTMAAACTDSEPPTPQQQAEDYFETDVYPVLANNCASCHTTQGVTFMGTDAGSTYVDLTNSALVGNYTSSAPLLHPPVMPMTADQTALFMQWFSLERVARGL